MLRCGGKGAGRRLLQQFLLPAAESTAAAEVACQQLRFFRQTASSNVQAAVAGRSFQNAGARSACSRGFAAAAAESGPAKRGPVSVLSLALTAATGGGLLWYYNHMMQEKLQQAVIKQESAGKPRIGGPFQLVDQNGNAFSDRDLVGKWALLYFGFTFCPDICPDELDKMVAAIDSIEKGCGEAVQPVFISLDPARDTVPQMRRYCAEFHPRLIGLTGSVEQCEAAAKAYRVYHMKTEETEDYLVDHSIIMYLLDPSGSFVQFYGKNYDAEALSKAVEQQIADWKPAEQSAAEQPRQQTQPQTAG